MKVNLPLEVFVGKKKYRINLNQYRNWNHFASANVKREYTRIALSRMTFQRFEKISLVFTLFMDSKRRIDRSNVLSITEKFFCDALTAGRFISDDNDSIIIETIYRSGEVDRENGRVEVEIIDRSND